MQKLKVYYGNNFWEKTCGGRPAECIYTGTHFMWAGYEWIVPAVYIAPKGIVCDICRKIPMDQVRAFYDKWQDRAGADLPDETAEQIERESPMNLPVQLEGWVNGQPLVSKGWSGTCWQSCTPDYNDEEAEALMEAYGCDKQYAWYFIRANMAWAEKAVKAPDIKKIDIQLISRPALVPCGEHFKTENGCAPFNVFFKHPVTGADYTVHIGSCTARKVDQRKFRDKHMIYPEYMSVLTYGIEPEIDREMFEITDCARGDAPIAAKEAGSASKTMIGGCVSVIFGQSGEEDAPNKDSDGIKADRAAGSAMHFQPVDTVNWRMYVRVKQAADLKVNLMDKKEG